MRAISWLLSLLATLTAVSFALSNSQNVALTLWPLPFEMQLPLFAVGFIGLFAGFFLGAVAVWTSRAVSRMRKRRSTRPEADKPQPAAFSGLADGEKAKSDQLPSLNAPNT